MPPLPMVPQVQFQQQPFTGPSQLERGHPRDVAPEGILPGAPDATPPPPLHTHSSKFPIEREVIVSSVEKASDTFKAKIPLIQDYGKRLVGGVVGGGGIGGGVGGGVARGGAAAVAPDAPIKQTAWTEDTGKVVGRKVTPSIAQHYHHKPPPNTHVHGGIYGQHFQSPDGSMHNRQLCDPMTPHHYNGQQMGAIPRREWSNSPTVVGDDGPSHRNHGEYVQSHQQPARNDSGITWSTPNTMKSQGAYGNMQCNPGTSKVDSTQKDIKGECAIVKSGVQQKVEEVEVEQHHSRTEFDVEANVMDSEKCVGRLPNQQPSSKPFPSRTYHHIKDMISSRFGGGSKVLRDAGVGGSTAGGDAEGSLDTSVRGGKEDRQSLNNSGCRSILNINEASSSRAVPYNPQQPSNRKSNNLGDREEGHQRAEGGGHYQQSAQQFRKTDNNSGNISVDLSAGGKEQCIEQQHGFVQREPLDQKGYLWAGSSAGDEYRQCGMRRTAFRDGVELGRSPDGSERLDLVGQQPKGSGREESITEDPVLRESMQLEFSMGSMGIGEPAFYSTPVGEQGQQKSAKFSSSYALNGSEADVCGMVQNVRQQHGPGNISSGGHGNDGRPPIQGFISSNLSRLSVGAKKEEKLAVGAGKGGGEEGAGGSGTTSAPPTRGGRREEGGGGGLCQEGGHAVQSTGDVGSAGGSGSMGGGSSDYEKTTHRSGRSTSTDSGRGTAGHGMVGGSRKGTPHDDIEKRERKGSGGGGLNGTRLDGVGADLKTVHHPGSCAALYGHGGQQHSAHDTEWVDVVESELQQILDPKLHSMGGSYGMTMSGVANSVVSESMSMTPPLPPLSPGGSPPSSPLCARKDRGKHYKLSASLPYINKSSTGQMEQKLQGSSGHIVAHGGLPHHVIGKGGGSGGSSRLYQAMSHPSGISIRVRQQERVAVGGAGRGPGGLVEGGGGKVVAKGGGGWGGSNKGCSATPGFGDRGRASMRKDQQYHGGPSNSVKAMLGNAIPLASFGAPPGFDNGDLTSTTTGLDLDSMLDGPTENTSEEDMSATIDTTDAHAIRKQLEGLENMYSEVLKLLGVKKHGSRYQPSDPRINKRRMYGSLSSLPSSASSRPVRDKRRHEDRKKVKDIKGINKRFQRLESHVVTLARSVAHLSSEMRTQHLMMQEIETMRGEIAQLRAQPMRPPSVPWLNGKVPIEKDSFCNNVPALTNPERVKKLTKFFGDEPPLLRIFLKKLGYEKYASAFEHERVGLVELPYLTEERLQKMGIPMGPRLRILQEAQLSLCQENMSVYVV